MEPQSKEETIQDPAEGPVKRKEFPLKQVISLKELQNRLTIQKCKSTNVALKYQLEGIVKMDLLGIQMEHAEEEFYIFCICKDCLQYREVILRLMIDHFSMRSMWKILRKIMTKFYKPIIETASANALDLYEIWVEDNKYSWLVNGILDRTKLQHLEFISDLSLTENVILVLFSTLFIVEDAHQLLELMSYQVECFARAYTAGLSDKVASIDKGQCSAEDVINYVLNGYEETCKVAEEMSRFLFAFEINHLNQFGLDWVLLNKRMYQRYVYADFVTAMPKCIIKLKDEVSTTRYAELVRKCIKFDEDMTEINKKWEDIWSALDEYHISPQDQDRRKRLKSVHDIFEVIRQDISAPYLQFVDIPNWETYEDKQIVWQNMVAYIKKRWPATDEFRLNAAASEELCKSCNNHSQEFHKDDCACVTCLIAGGPSVSKFTKESKKEGICLKCSITEKMEKDSTNFISKVLSKNSPSKQGALQFEEKNCSKQSDSPQEDLPKEDKSTIISENNVEYSEIYHLSWAVFKHLRDRIPYPYKTIEEKYFCSNCSRTSCSLAKKFINREIAFCLAHHLIKNYQPFSITLDKLVETVPCVVMYNHKALSILHDPTNDDLILKTLWTFITSLVASYFADADADATKPQVDQLKIVNNDIELPMQHIEEKVKSKKFIDFFGKTLGILQPDEQCFGPALTPKALKENLLKQMSPKPTSEGNNKNIEENSKEIYEDPPVRLEPELIKPREVADPPKAKSACCGEQHCRENHMNRTCSHEKETSSRISETRDRLRKKLSQLTSAKKNVKTINKSAGKSPLDLIKVLNRNPPSLSSLSKEMAKMQNKANVSKEITNKTIVKLSQEKEEKPVVIKESKGTNTVTQIEEETNENLDEWVKDTLSFIEGCAEPKKVKNVVNNKKAAKKAKQKLKKEEQKRIEELQDIRSQFHDLYFKEFMSKNELKTQKSAKKKDKKRISELESNIKKLSKAKSKIETSILELIATVKSTNSEFKFPYLPTKEQQQEILQKTAPTSEPPPITSISVNNNKNSIQTETPPRVYYPTEPQFVPPSEFRSPPAHNVQVAYPPPPSNNLADPAKGIVTIRRVNLPNVHEPQVTVTAKGPSPDKDKLLYTFINGQLVPANSLDARTLSVLQPTIFPIELKNAKQSQKKEPQRLRANVQKNSALVEEPVTKTKTQLKKERKRAKKLAAEMEQKIDELKAVKQLASNTKRSKHVKETPIDLLNGKVKKVSNKDQNKPQSKCPSSDSGINSREHSASDGKSKIPKSSKVLSQPRCLTDNTKDSETSVERSVEKTQDKKDVKHRKVVDNGQFDNNQFKMLHLDEFSSESEESVIVPNKVKSKTKLSQDKDEKSNRQNQKKQAKVENTEKPIKEVIQKETKPIPQKKTIASKSIINHNPILEENKKQKKKVNKKQNNKAISENVRNYPTNIDKKVPHLDNSAKSLRHSMQRLNLNTDAAVINENSENNTSMSNLNISIMEQLNRGVQVEDLTLPPGITLTKVDPSRAEALRAKTESIGKLSQPMQPQQQQNSMGPPIISPALLPHLGRYGGDQNGVIMVDAMGAKTTAELPTQNDSKKSKKNKRRSKKKKGENSPDDSLIKQKNCESKMITLRNPMFHGPSMRVLPMPNNAPIAPLPMDQPAAIIKNENGMFTIRNPALHQAFSSGSVPNNYRSYNPNFYTSTENCRNFSYFSDNISNSSQFSNGPIGPKCLSAIGSEIKTAQQQKKTGNQWSSQSNCSSQNKCGYVGEPNHFSSMQQKYQQSAYCNNFDVFSPSPTSNLFDANSHDAAHNCEETPPPSRSGYNHYLDDIPNQVNRGSKYDDMSFFRSLIPGQRLNSEVTIHNINESKFSPNSPSPHNVEITPISRPTSRSNNFSPEHQDNLQSKGFSGNLGDYKDNLFTPNHMINLNDFETEDRDVEPFKRYNYGFEPPKEEPKVNLNVNDLLATKKPPNARTSPYLDESLENFVRNMSSLKISPENAVNGSSQDTNDRSNWW